MNNEKSEIEKEKELMWETLKFTPGDYTFTVYGYGGESRFIISSINQYKYFKENNIDIEEYASSWDNEFDVPDEMQPFPQGSPYDGNEIETACGATFESSSYLQVSDPEGNVIFECSFDPEILLNNGIEFDCDDEFFPHNYNGVLIWNGQGEKGTFLGDQIHLTSPFDPKKIKVSYIDIDGWEIISSVSYDGVDIEANDYSTTGKWGETRWINVDEYDEDDESVNDQKQETEVVAITELPKTTDWFPVNDYKPAYKGMYECMLDPASVAWPFANIEMVEWSGRKWKSEKKITQWRGLTEKA